MTTIAGISEAVAAVAATTGASVVGVAGGRHRSRSAGSGVVVAPGRILTNAHNLWSQDVTVTFADGRTVVATPLGVDTEGDVAVLEADTGDAPVAGWAEGGLAIGSPVFGVANPGGRGLRVTFGFVSRTQASFRGPRGRRISGSVEHTAPLLPGSSGGPIVDADGKLLGINTHRLGEGFYLAIVADDALKQRVDALSRGKSPARVRLGVALASTDVTRRLRRAVGLPEVDGLLVRAVEDDSPAAKAGLREGDVLIEGDGRPLQTTDDLFAVLEAADGKLTLRVARGAEEIDVEVTL